MMHQLKRLTASVAMAAAPAAVIAFSAATAVAQPSTPSPSPTPNPQGATKVTIDTTNRDCSGTAQSDHGSGTGSGFAVINLAGPSGMPRGQNGQGQPPGQKVIANVNLTNATPNTTYAVRLIETPQNPNPPCGVNPGNGVFGGTLQTDASGNGQVNIQEPLLPGKNDAFVVLNGAGNDFYTSPDVTFSTG